MFSKAPSARFTQVKGHKDVTAETHTYPVLPLRDIVVFPHMIVPLFVGRDKSVRALEDVMKDDKQIMLVAQKNAGQDDPGIDDIFRVGTVSSVLQLLKLPDGTVKKTRWNIHSIYTALRMTTTMVAAATQPL